MKTLKQALEMARKAQTPRDRDLQQITDAVEAAEAKSARMEEALDALLTYLYNNIRYKTWPYDGLGIGLQVDEFDEHLQEADAALAAARRGVRKKKDTPAG